MKAVLPHSIVALFGTFIERRGYSTVRAAAAKLDAVSPETREPGPRPEPQLAALEASSYEICQYGAERLQPQQSDWLGGDPAAMRSDTGCENLWSRLFGLAERSEDLAPFAVRGGAFLTGAEPAISIPVSAIAEAEAAGIPVGALPPVPESQAPPIRPATGCGAALSCEKGKQLSTSNFVALLFTRLRFIFD
jgi:hypothetical protein